MSTGSCLNDASVWGNTLSHATRLHITSMLGRTLHSLMNSSIEEFWVLNSSSESVNDRVTDVFKVLSLALNPLTPSNKTANAGTARSHIDQWHRRRDSFDAISGLSVGPDIVGQSRWKCIRNAERHASTHNQQELGSGNTICARMSTSSKPALLCLYILSTHARCEPWVALT
jgi:hypothetical protein